VQNSWPGCNFLFFEMLSINVSQTWRNITLSRGLFNASSRSVRSDAGPGPCLFNGKIHTSGTGVVGCATTVLKILTV
jgi:hypothetical protein